jgi:hypothetical protein
MYTYGKIKYKEQHTRRRRGIFLCAVFFKGIDTDIYIIQLIVIESHCGRYCAGDEIVFDGPLIDRTKSGEH